MRIRRGDVLIADFPHATGTQTTRRPVLVVQADYYNQRIHNVVIALVTTNLRNARDPAHFLIDVSTPEGQQSGLSRDSVVSCINLVTVDEDRLVRRIGALSTQAMLEVDKCLKAGLGIP